MCQMSVLMNEKDTKQNIIEDVTKIEVTETGIMIYTYFDEPRLVEDLQIKEINCLKSTVILSDKEI